MKKEEELMGSMKKLNNRLTILEECVRMLEQRVAGVEELNRLNEKKIGRSLQELSAHEVDLRGIKSLIEGLTTGVQKVE